MAHMLELSDEQYETLCAVAARDGESPEQLVARMIASLSDVRDPLTDPRYFETDEWLRHLGMSDEDIASAQRDALADADADARRVCAVHVRLAGAQRQSTAIVRQSDCEDGRRPQSRRRIS